MSTSEHVFTIRNIFVSLVCIPLTGVGEVISTKVYGIRLSKSSLIDLKDRSTPPIFPVYKDGRLQTGEVLIPSATCVVAYARRFPTPRQPQPNSFICLNPDGTSLSLLVVGPVTAGTQIFYRLDDKVRMFGEKPQVLMMWCMYTESCTNLLCLRLCLCLRIRLCLCLCPGRCPGRCPGHCP
jgi:hypothetical protein